MLMHGITFAGHPVAAAIALRNVEIFEREGVLENVRELEPYLRRAARGHQGARADRRRRPRRRVLLGAGARARRRRRRASRAEEREKLLRGFLAGRLLEEGLIARPGRPRRRRAAPRPAADLHPRGARGDGGEDRGRAGRRVGALLRGVIHTAHGYWLAEAGAVEPAPALAGDVTRRRRRHRRRLHRACGRPGSCASAARRSSCSRPSCAGTGRAGATAASARRCGRTCRRWSSASARDRALERLPGARPRASRRSAPGARSRASTPGSRARGYVMASTAPAHDAVLDEILAVAPRDRVRALERGRRARPLRLAALPPRAVRAPTTRRSSRRGSRSGLRARRARGAASRLRALAGAGRCTTAPAGVAAETARRARARGRRGAGRQRRHARLSAAAQRASR